MTYLKPETEFTRPQQAEMKQAFRYGSRIRALLDGSASSIGASCNVKRVEDSIEGIADAHRWAYGVLKYQGAPSLDFSALRPPGSALNKKGTASGAVSFMIPYDAIISTMLRAEKKNGAGIGYLDYKHPELDAFLAHPFKRMYRGVYVPMHDTPEAAELLADSAMVEKLTKAYDEFKCFLVKRPLDGRMINMCTEVELEDEDYCILGSINLSVFTWQTLPKLVGAFEYAMEKLAYYDILAQDAQEASMLKRPTKCQRQVGLAIYGMASFLGANGISYSDFSDSLEYALYLGTASRFANAHKGTKADLLAEFLLYAYERASVVARTNNLRAAFTVHPHVSMAQVSLDAYGYFTSPEIQPVEGLRHENAVSTILKSAIKGDKQIDYHPGTWTLDDVSYPEYARFSSLFQQLMDSTGLAHRLSHCFYDKEFTTDNFRSFYQGDLRHIKSLYYRLNPQVNRDSLNKAALWQDVAEGELGDFDSFISQRKGAITCECES